MGKLEGRWVQIWETQEKSLFVQLYNVLSFFVCEISEGYLLEETER